MSGRFLPQFVAHELLLARDNPPHCLQVLANCYIFTEFFPYCPALNHDPIQYTLGSNFLIFPEHFMLSLALPPVWDLPIILPGDSFDFHDGGSNCHLVGTHRENC